MNRVPKLKTEKGYKKLENIWYHADIYQHIVSRSLMDGHVDQISSQQILSIIDKMIETFQEKKFYSKNQERLREALTIQVFSTIINFNRGIRACEKAVSKIKEEEFRIPSGAEIKKIRNTLLPEYTENLGHLRVYQSKSAFYRNDYVKKFDHLNYEVQKECIQIMVSSGLFTLKIGTYNFKNPEENRISEIHIHKDAQKNVLSCIPESFRTILTDEQLWLLQILFLPTHDFKDLLETYPWGQDEIGELQLKAIERAQEKRQNKTLLSYKEKGEKKRKELHVENPNLKELDRRLYGNLSEIYPHKQVYTKGKHEDHLTHGRYYSKIQSLSGKFRKSFSELTGKSQVDISASLPNHISLIETGEFLTERPYSLPFKEAYKKKLKAKNKRQEKIGMPAYQVDDNELKSAMDYVGNCMKKAYLSVNNTSKKSLRKIYYSEAMAHNLIISKEKLARYYTDNSFYESYEIALEILESMKSENPALYSKMQSSARNHLIAIDLKKKGITSFNPAILFGFTFTFKNFYEEYTKLHKHELQYLDSGLSNQYMHDESKFMINTVCDLPEQIPLIMVHDEIIVPKNYEKTTDRLINKNHVQQIINTYGCIKHKVNEYLYNFDNKNVITSNDLNFFFKIFPSEFEQSILYKYLSSISIEFQNSNIVNFFLKKYRNSNSNFEEILSKLNSLLNEFIHYWERKRLKKKVNLLFNKYIDKLITYRMVIRSTTCEIVPIGKPPP